MTDSPHAPHGTRARRRGDEDGALPGPLSLESAFVTTQPQKTRPPYAITSVDHALRVATMLQLEGPVTVTEVAARLGVARSTAHRILAMLVYRDFAAQRSDLSYTAGPILEVAPHSRAEAARVREVGLPHLDQLAKQVRETVNLVVRTGTTAWFIASVEATDHDLRVATREGMGFPAHRTSAGLLLLSELSDSELHDVYAGKVGRGRIDTALSLSALRQDLARIRKLGFAINLGRAERGVVAIGVPVRAPDGTMIAGLSMSMPTIRYDKRRLNTYVGTLKAAATRLELALAEC